MSKVSVRELRAENPELGAGLFRSQLPAPCSLLPAPFRGPSTIFLSIVGYNMVKVYKTETRVRYAETDAAGIVYYANFLIYFEVGRIEMFRELDLPYDLRLPIVETHCEFKKPVSFNDLLEIHTSVPEIMEKGFKIENKIYCKDNDELVLVAEGYTTMLTADENRNVCKVPQLFLDKFSL
jgi:acyl-CoA thioester hydrolase